MKAKLVQVGLGRFGKSWVKVCLESKDWEVATLVDKNKETLYEVAAEYGFNKDKCYTDLGQALDKEEADAVLVAVPPAAHAEVSLQALEAGKHVLVEKPLADNWGDAKRLVEEAERRGLSLMVSQNYRFRRAPRTIRRYLKTGEMGKPGYVVIESFQEFKKEWHSPGHFRLAMDHPLLVDLSIHHFDLIRYILALEPVKIWCRSWRPEWSWFKGDPCVTGFIEMQDDVKIAYIATWVGVGSAGMGWQTQFDGNWRIVCRKGEIRWSKEGVELVPRENSPRALSLIELEVQDRAYSLAEFTRSISENRPAETNGRDNLKSLAMMLAAMESASENKAVSLTKYLG